MISQQQGTRSSLGAVVAALLRAAHDLGEDAISQHYGVYPDPMPTYERIARERGWQLDDVRAEVEQRVSGHWYYVSGLSEIVA